MGEITINTPGDLVIRNGEITVRMHAGESVDLEVISQPSVIGFNFILMQDNARHMLPKFSLIVTIIAIYVKCIGPNAVQTSIQLFKCLELIKVINDYF